MEIIECIRKKYNGNIILNSPLNEEKTDLIPENLLSILKISNGIEESMIINGKPQSIYWIVYSYDEILSETNYYADTYGIEGIVFSSNGAGNPFIIKSDGKIYEFNPIDNKETIISENLFDFFNIN